MRRSGNALNVERSLRQNQKLPCSQHSYRKYLMTIVDLSEVEVLGEMLDEVVWLCQARR